MTAKAQFASALAPGREWTRLIAIGLFGFATPFVDATDGYWDIHGIQRGDRLMTTVPRNEPKTEGLRLNLGLEGGKQLRGANNGLANGDFLIGLDGWTIDVLGGVGNPGTIAVDSGVRALLLENSSFLITLRQTFALPDNARELSFEVFFDPGFDLTDNFIPDAFEVQLLDDQMQSVVPTWDPLATSFFNVQEDIVQNPADAINLAPGVTMEPIDGGGLPAWRVHVDLTGVPAGTIVTLFNDLIGGDGDTASGVRVDNFILNTQPPVSDPGGPYFAQCGTEISRIQLDGTRSSDPDQNVLRFQWSTDCQGATFDDETSPTPVLTLPGSVTQCSVTLSISDGAFPPVATSTTIVKGNDDVSPTITCPSTLIVAATTVSGVPVQDVLLVADASDNCSDAVVSDNRPGDFYPLGDSVVTFLARDAAGIEATCRCTVTVVQPDIPILNCPTLIATEICPGQTVLVDSILGSIAAIGQEPLSTKVSPESFSDGENFVTVTVTDKDGNTAECSISLTISRFEAGSAPCLDIPSAEDRFQESLTTTTTEIGFFACGSCGAVGLLPMALTIVGMFVMKLGVKKTG